MRFIIGCIRNRLKRQNRYSLNKFYDFIKKCIVRFLYLNGWNLVYNIHHLRVPEIYAIPSNPISAGKCMTEINSLAPTRKSKLHT